jgi:mono/diheme cytochrome c family protein
VICHGSGLNGAARQDAPSDLNFDDLATVRDEAESMYGEAKDGEMPTSPYPRLSDSELESMRIWLACGAEDVAVQ